MIRKCNESDFEAIYSIINDAASAYNGVIPQDRWHEPYMSKEDLRTEIGNGVQFWGYEDENELVGVIGHQPVLAVTLIRHAYVKTALQNYGIGSKLLTFLLNKTAGPILIGTWATATWAIAFYQKHGFKLVTDQQKNILLQKYWSIPMRQIETSVVLSNAAGFQIIA